MSANGVSGPSGGVVPAGDGSGSSGAPLSASCFNPRLASSIFLRAHTPPYEVPPDLSSWGIHAPSLTPDEKCHYDANVQLLNLREGDPLLIEERTCLRNWIQAVDAADKDFLEKIRRLHGMSPLRRPVVGMSFREP